MEDEIRHRQIVEKRLQCAEKELYRMHQKKYELEKDIRKEEVEKRKQEEYMSVVIREEGKNSTTGSSASIRNNSAS